MYPIGVDVLHAIIRTDGREVARAVKIWLQDLSQTIQLKFIPVKNVIEQDNLLIQPDRDVRGHGDRSDHELTLVHEVDELSQRKMAEVECSTPLCDSFVLLMFLLAPQKERHITGLFQLSGEGDPVLFRPKP